MECTVAIPGFLKAWSASHTFLYSQTGKTLASLLFLVLCNQQPTYLPSPGLSFQENPQKVFLCNPKNIPLSLCKRPPSQTKISPYNSFSSCSPSQKKNLSVTSNKITSLSGNLFQLPLSGFSQATPFLFLQALLSAQKLPQPALLTCSPSSPKYLTSGHCPFFLLSQLDLSCSPIAARFLVLCFAHSSLASPLLPLTCSFFLLLSVSHPFHCSQRRRHYPQPPPWQGGHVHCYASHAAWLFRKEVSHSFGCEKKKSTPKITKKLDQNEGLHIPII